MAIAHRNAKTRVATAGTWLDAQQASEYVRKRNHRRVLRLGIILTVLVVFSVTIGYKPLFQNNFAEVVPGRLYRSAQPDDRLVKWIEDHNIRSVLNLRGGKPSYAWYDQELKTIRETGVDYYELPMSAQLRPQKRELLQLIDLLGRARYPMLIHCKSGADRTGLGVTLYHMIVQKEPPEKALGGFTVYHAHIPLLGPEKLQQPIREYASWLSNHQMIHTPERFRDWVEKEYVDGRETPAERASTGSKSIQDPL
ncbi:MAG: tyrosine-protein phosphatase [Planctomycetota bacterium]